MIDVVHLVKRYGPHLAVDDVSFSVGQGQIVGFLGPNGAGKSTTLRILAGFLGMTSGSVRVGGHDIVHDSFEARRCIGYMPEAVPLYPEMRVREYLTFRAELKRVAHRQRAAFVDEAMHKAKVADRAGATIATLSKGYRQRVGLADALVAKPPILILDEPTAGLDPNQIREVRDVIRELGARHTVLLSTHILSEAEASCDRVMLIAKGRLVAEGATDEIRNLRRAPAVDITARGDPAQIAQVLGGVEGIVGVERIGPPAPVATCRCVWLASLAEDAVGEATERAVASLVGAGVHVRGVKAAGGTLEEVFAELTAETKPAPEESR